MECARIRAVILRLCLIASLVSLCAGGNVFISVTYGEGSHYAASTAIGAELVRRGHNVTYLISNAFEHRARHPVHSELFHYEVFNHSVPVEMVHRRMREIAAHAFNTDFNVDMIFTLKRWLNPLVKDCRAVFRDQALLQRLRDANFDIAVIDVTWGCSVLLNAYVGTPTVLFTPLASGYPMAQFIGAPFVPSIVPESILGTPQKMHFLQRVFSALTTPLASLATFAFFVGLHEPLRQEFGILENQTMTSYLRQNTELVLTANHHTIDVIMPLPPAVIEVGGLLTRPAQPLEKGLDDFMNGAGDDGVIVLSLGTYVKVMPQRLNDLFASVFARLPQRVVWQLPEDSPTKLSENVKTMSWLPQNDLLGHRNTRLFIYQGGNNGLYEALYHGVPILVLPVFADQICVAARVTEKGMGSSLDIHSLNAPDLEKAIKNILHDETYAKTAKRLSAIYRDRPETPSERAAFWVEHVMKFGGKHMEMPSKHMGFIELAMLDVYAFLIGCLIVILVVMFFTCRCMFRCCKGFCGGSTSSKTKRD